MANKLGTKQTAADIVQAKGIAIAAAEVLYHYKLIARAANRDEDTLAIWRKEDKDFSDKLEQGRVRFLEKNIKVAKPEFLLERMERGVFGPPKQQMDVTGIDSAAVLLEAYGIIKADKNDDTKDDGAVQSASQS